MVTRYLWSPKDSKCILFPISSSPRATSGGRALSRRVPADFAAGSLIAAFCCKVLHFIASSRGDSGACCTAESAVALSAATVEVRASAVFCCIVLAAGNKVLHAEQPRGIIARPDDRHHQMLVRP